MREMPRRARRYPWLEESYGGLLSASVSPTVKRRTDDSSFPLHLLDGMVTEITRDASKRAGPRGPRGPPGPALRAAHNSRKKFGALPADRATGRPRTPRIER